MLHQSHIVLYMTTIHSMLSNLGYYVVGVDFSEKGNIKLTIIHENNEQIVYYNVQQDITQHIDRNFGRQR
jgi:hypothetical protein